MWFCWFLFVVSTSIYDCIHVPRCCFPSMATIELPKPDNVSIKFGGHNCCYFCSLMFHSFYMWKSTMKWICGNNHDWKYLCCIQKCNVFFSSFTFKYDFLLYFFQDSCWNGNFRHSVCFTSIFFFYVALLQYTQMFWVVIIFTDSNKQCRRMNVNCAVCTTFRNSI